VGESETLIVLQPDLTLTNEKPTQNVQKTAAISLQTLDDFPSYKPPFLDEFAKATPPAWRKSHKGEPLSSRKTVFLHKAQPWHHRHGVSDPCKARCVKKEKGDFEWPMESVVSVVVEILWIHN
jgi:hypothetical protein